MHNTRRPHCVWPGRLRPEPVALPGPELLLPLLHPGAGPLRVVGLAPVPGRDRLEVGVGGVPVHGPVLAAVHGDGLLHGRVLPVHRTADAVDPGLDLQGWREE